MEKKKTCYRYFVSYVTGKKNIEKMCRRYRLTLLQVPVTDLPLQRLHSIISANRQFKVSLNIAQRNN